MGGVYHTKKRSFMINREDRRRLKMLSSAGISLHFKLIIYYGVGPQLSFLHPRRLRAPYDSDINANLVENCKSTFFKLNLSKLAELPTKMVGTVFRVV